MEIPVRQVSQVSSGERLRNGTLPGGLCVVSESLEPLAEPQQRAVAFQGVVVESEAPQCWQLAEGALGNPLNLVAVKESGSGENGEGNQKLV